MEKPRKLAQGGVPLTPHLSFLVTKLRFVTRVRETLFRGALPLADTKRSFAEGVPKRSLGTSDRGDEI